MAEGNFFYYRGFPKIPTALVDHKTSVQVIIK